MYEDNFATFPSFLASLEVVEIKKSIKYSKNFFKCLRKGDLTLLIGSKGPNISSHTWRKVTWVLGGLNSASEAGK